MPTARANFGICTYEDKIYAIGGTTGPGAVRRYQGGGDEIKVTGVNEVYDPSTDTWENNTSMPTPRADASISVVNNKLYVIGGYGVDLKDTKVTEVYDPTRDTWTEKAAAPFPFRKFASAVVNANIYLFGSTQFYNDLMQIQWTTYTLVYNVESDSWSYAKPSSMALYDPGVGQTAGTLAPKAIYVISYNNITQRYDPESGTWSLGAQMPLYSDDFGAAVLDDLIYVVGGGSASFPMLYIFNQNEQYTPIEYGNPNYTFPTPTPSQSPSAIPSPTSTPTSSPSLSPSPSPTLGPSPSIPELPTWIILLIFTVATLLSIVFIKRKC